jgi:hypothetical protein
MNELISDEQRHDHDACQTEREYYPKRLSRTPNEK